MDDSTDGTAPASRPTAGAQASLADVVGHERNGGKVLAAFSMAQDLGTIVGPVLIGVAADRFGFEVAFALCGVVCLVAFLAWLRAPETIGRPDASASSPTTSSPADGSCSTASPPSSPSARC